MVVVAEWDVLKEISGPSGKGRGEVSGLPSF